MADGLQAAGGDGSTGLGGLGAVTSCALAGYQASRLLVPHRPAEARCHPTVETGSGSPWQTKASDCAPRAASLPRPCSTQPAWAANWRSASVSVPPFALMLRQVVAVTVNVGRHAGRDSGLGTSRLSPRAPGCGALSPPPLVGAALLPFLSSFPARGPPRCPAGQLPDSHVPARLLAGPLHLGLLACLFHPLDKQPPGGMGALRGCGLGRGGGLPAGAGTVLGWWPGPGGCSFVWGVGSGAWTGLWGPWQVSCPQQHPCPTLTALGVEGMQGRGSPSPDPQTPKPLSLRHRGWKPTVTGVEPGSAPGDRGRGLVGAQAHACCCAFPSRRGSPGPSLRQAAPSDPDASTALGSAVSPGRSWETPARCPRTGWGWGRPAGKAGVQLCGLPWAGDAPSQAPQLGLWGGPQRRERAAQDRGWPRPRTHAPASPRLPPPPGLLQPFWGSGPS